MSIQDAFLANSLSLVMDPLSIEHPLIVTLPPPGTSPPKKFTMHIYVVIARKVYKELVIQTPLVFTQLLKNQI